jgi:hypothetical protein
MPYDPAQAMEIGRSLGASFGNVATASVRAEQDLLKAQGQNAIRMNDWVTQKFIEGGIGFDPSDPTKVPDFLKNSPQAQLLWRQNAALKSVEAQKNVYDAISKKVDLAGKAVDAISAMQKQIKSLNLDPEKASQYNDALVQNLKDRLNGTFGEGTVESLGIDVDNMMKEGTARDVYNRTASLLLLGSQQNYSDKRSSDAWTKYSMAYAADPEFAKSIGALAPSVLREKYPTSGDEQRTFHIKQTEKAIETDAALSRARREIAIKQEEQAALLPGEVNKAVAVDKAKDLTMTVQQGLSNLRDEYGKLDENGKWAPDPTLTAQRRAAELKYNQLIKKGKPPADAYLEAVGNVTPATPSAPISKKGIAPKKTIVQTGTEKGTGRKTVRYSDGTISYAP